MARREEEAPADFTLEPEGKDASIKQRGGGRGMGGERDVMEGNR